MLKLLLLVFLTACSPTKANFSIDAAGFESIELLEVTSGSLYDIPPGLIYGSDSQGNTIFTKPVGCNYLIQHTQNTYKCTHPNPILKPECCKCDKGPND